MLAVFWQTLDENKPKWQLDNGLIGSNPGLGFRPMPPESNVESTLVWFEASDSKNTDYWIGALDEFLASKFDEFLKNKEKQFQLKLENVMKSFYKNGNLKKKTVENFKLLIS